MHFASTHILESPPPLVSEGSEISYKGEKSFSLIIESPPLMKNDFSQGIFLLQIFTEVRLLIMDTLLVIVWQSRLYRIAGCLMLFPREKELTSCLRRRSNLKKN